MQDSSKTYRELFEENALLMQRIKDLESAETEHKRTEEALRKSEAKIRGMYETIVDLYFETDSEGRITLVSPSLRGLTGLNQKDVIGQPVSVLYANPDDRKPLLLKFSENGYVNDYEVLLKGKDGGVWHTSLSARRILDDNRQPMGIRGLLRDITERKRLEEELRKAEAYARNLIEKNLDTMVNIAPDGRIVNINRAGTLMTGYPREEMIGTDFSLYVVGSDHAGVGVQEVIERGTVRDHPMDIRHRDGHVTPVLYNATVLLGETRQVTGILASARDITQLKQAEEQIRHMANHDALTDLPTLRLAHDRLSMAVNMARRVDARAAVLFIDLDGFKTVNDTLGHNAGDDVLKQVAERLRSCVRKTDTVARFGGDEFLIIATELHDHESAAVIAGKVVEILSKPFIFNERQAAIGASVGIALFPDHGEDNDHLIKRADEAMYIIKKAGKNGYQFANPAS